MTIQVQVFILIAACSAEFPANFRTVPGVDATGGLCGSSAAGARCVHKQQNGPEKGAA